MVARVAAHRHELLCGNPNSQGVEVAVSVGKSVGGIVQIVQMQGPSNS